MTPHLECGYDFPFFWGLIETFILSDWTFLFEGSIVEYGIGPLDMTVQARNSSLLLVEGGLRSYQSWHMEGDTWILRQTIAYVFKNPHSIGHLIAAIPNGPGTFTVQSFAKNQNLLTLGFEASYFSEIGWFGTLNYNGEFGSDYESNVVQAKIGCNF